MKKDCDNCKYGRDRGILDEPCYACESNYDGTFSNWEEEIEMKNYKVVIATGSTNCTTYTDEEPREMLKNLKNTEWLSIPGDPYLCIHIPRIDSISFTEVKDEDTK